MQRRRWSSFLQSLSRSRRKKQPNKSWFGPPMRSTICFGTLGDMRKKNQEGGARCRVLVLVDESNVGSSVRTAGRGLDWLKLRDFLAGPDSGRDLIEMVVYAGLPPAI